MGGEVRGMCPIQAGRGSIDPKSELGRIGDDHDPFGGWGMPGDVRVAEIRVIKGYYGVVLVLGERVTTIVGIRQGLCLLGGGCEGVVGEDTICLIGEKTGCVVRIDNAGAGEDQGCIVDREDCDFLIRPVVEVSGRGVAPVLVAGYCSIGVILIVEMVQSVGVEEHAIWVVHEAFRR